MCRNILVLVVVIFSAGGLSNAVDSESTPGEHHIGSLSEPQAMVSFGLFT
jgi:hypothetical protein